MPGEKDIAQDKKALEQNERAGKTAELEGENAEHAPQPGRKTPPKDLADEDATDESGDSIADGGGDETGAH